MIGAGHVTDVTFGRATSGSTSQHLLKCDFVTSYILSYIKSSFMVHLKSVNNVNCLCREGNLFYHFGILNLFLRVAYVQLLPKCELCINIFSLQMSS